MNPVKERSPKIPGLVSSRRAAKSIRRELTGSGKKSTLNPSWISALLVFGALTASQLRVRTPRPSLLLERYFSGWGWLEVFLISAYAFWLTGKMLNPAKSPVWRRRAWKAFSVVFFGQLAIGLTGADLFLQTGKLHLPVPALILAGPIYRGRITFMLILFLATVVLLGSAWCSHLCYVGVWDDAAASAGRRPSALPLWHKTMRLVIFGLMMASAWLFRQAGASSFAAPSLAAAFGIGGLGIMVYWSRRKGQMVHCILYCPIGLAADILAKINPFRIRIAAGCDLCGACSLACRYNALSTENIRRRKPGLTCTLCGDCLRSCHARVIEYRCPGLGAQTARTLFIIMAVSLHSLFLALARI